MIENAPDTSSSIFTTLAGRYPLTVAAFSQVPHGEESLKAVVSLQERWIALNAGEERPDPFNYVPTEANLPSCRAENSFDVVIAGGSLGLVAGVALAERGLRVLVFDKGKVGSAHREWNISERELLTLDRWGIFNKAELAGLVAARYRTGLIQFDAQGTGVPSCPLEVPGVLDIALDAQRVLDLARQRFTELGGTILEGRQFRKLHVAEKGQVASCFEVEGPDGAEFYRARLAVDTMGSTSPIAMGLNNGLPFSGVCPTAGTIIEGFDTDPNKGDVLVSVAPTQGGRQLIWEGFPGHNGETTVYLFYYDRTGQKPAREQRLLDLFEQYFSLLPTYHPTLPGRRHVKPVYGYIPSRHGRAGKTAGRGLICLGDSAAGQSPLTFCGFGSFVRHIGRISALVSYALRYDLLEERHLAEISPHQANLRVAWVFSRLMQPWSESDPAGVNRLMNVFCGALERIGYRTTLRFLQDRFTFREYLAIMLTTARIYPQVFPLTARVLGAKGLVRWAGDIASFGADDALRTGWKLLPAGTRRGIIRRASRFSKRITLGLLSRDSRWRATE